MGEGGPKAKAANACATCRSQKRKCDKRLPSCSRCSKMTADCNYLWINEEHQHNYSNGSNPFGSTTTLADFLLFHIPVTSHQQWLPGTFQPLQPCRQNISSRGLDIDQFFVGVLMTTLTEQNQTLDRVLDTYFVTLHPWLPILHERSFRERVQQLGVNPQAETALVMLIIFWYRNARSRSSHLVDLEVYEVGSSTLGAASLSIGTCARLGYILRLNIDTVRYLSDMAWIQAEEKRRTWLGVDMLDRLIKQISFEAHAPHAVEDPSIEYRLPIEDQEWDQLPECPPRETQAIRTLGRVQMLPKLTQPLLFHQQVDNLDKFLIQFMECLLDQTPGSWHVLCGANATVLLAAISLHRARLELEGQGDSPRSISDEINERSIVALRSIINMVTDICLRFNLLDPDLRAACVPLPAVVCIGEAARAAMWVCQLGQDGWTVAIEPLRQTLEYAGGSWGLAEYYIRQLG
ncbi:hypothetical protein BJX64DRAFT_282981 [Aspergillus heterothallicus]